jgi:hypothetical protein
LSSLRLAKKTRAVMRSRYDELRSVPAGPARIRILIDAARDRVIHAGRPWQVPDRLYSARRERHNEARDSWLGRAAFGTCFACGRSADRIWHHVLPLNNGGTNSARNRVRVCRECHAQIHPHLPIELNTNEAIYREATRAVESKPRLVRNPTCRRLENL